MRHTNVNSAVFVSGFRSVEILNTTVRHSQGSAISLINLCGKALVDGSNFLNNHQATSNGEVSEVYIEYSNCESNTKDGIETLINNSSFIHHSHGNAHAMNSLIVGGLSVTFNGNASNISLIIKDSVFLGATGSGLAIHFLELSKHNFVNVSSTYFADNLNFGSGYAPCNHSVNFGIHGDFSSSGGGFSLLLDGNSSDNKAFIENFRGWLVHSAVEFFKSQ